MTTTPAAPVIVEGAERDAAAAPTGVLRRNFSWTLAGNVVFAASQWGVLVVLAKAATPEQVGLFVLGLAIANPVVMLASLDLRLVQATDARGEYRFGDYFGLRLLLLVPALACILLLAWVIGDSRLAFAVLALVGIAKVVEALSDVFHGLFQRREQMQWMGRSLALRGLLSLALLTAAVLLGGGLLWGVVGLMVAALVVFVAYDLRVGRRLLAGPLLSASRAGARWSLTLAAFPLGVVALLNVLIPNLPRYGLEHYWSARELGIFAALAYLMVVGSTVKTALDHSFSPRLANLFAAADYQGFTDLLRRMLWIGVVIGVAGILVAWVAGRPLLALLYTPEYAEHSTTLLWLMVAAAFGHLGASLRFGIAAARRFAVQVALLVTTVLVLGVACLWLIPMYGLVGAALALAVALAVQAVASAAVMFRILREVACRAPDTPATAPLVRSTRRP